MAKEKMPFELQRPDANTPVTNATEIDYADIPLECGLVYDISVAHAVSNVPAQYESLSAALGTNGANIPQDVRRGGMIVKFINSSTNKYEQWNLKASTWSINTSDWVNSITPKAEDVSYRNGSVADVLDTISGELVQHTMLASELTSGKGIVASTGVATNHGNYGYSDFLPIAASSTIELKTYTANTFGVAFYSSDNEASYISGVVNTTGTNSIKVPANAKYFRWCNVVSTSVLDPTEYYAKWYDEEDSLIDRVETLDSSIKTRMNAVEGDISTLREDFDDYTENPSIIIDDSTTYTQGTINGYGVKAADGTLAEFEGWRASDFLPVPESMVLTYVNAATLFGIAFYSAANESSFISGVIYNNQSNVQLTIPSNATHFRYCSCDSSTHTLNLVCTSQSKQYISDLIDGVQDDVNILQSDVSTLSSNVGNLSTSVETLEEELGEYRPVTVELNNVDLTTGTIKTSDYSRGHYLYHVTDKPIKFKAKNGMQIYANGNNDGTLIATHNITGWTTEFTYTGNYEYLVFLVKNTNGNDVSSTDIIGALLIENTNAISNIVEKLNDKVDSLSESIEDISDSIDGISDRVGDIESSLIEETSYDIELYNVDLSRGGIKTNDKTRGHLLFHISDTPMKFKAKEGFELFANGNNDGTLVATASVTGWTTEFTYTGDYEYLVFLVKKTAGGNVEGNDLKDAIIVENTNSLPVRVTHIEDELANVHSSTLSNAILCNNKLPENKAEIKILCIGNSFTDDMTTYIADVLSDLGITNFSIGVCNQGGQTIYNQWQSITGATSNFTFTWKVQAANTTCTLTNTSNTNLKTIIPLEDWDIVTFNQARLDCRGADYFEANVKQYFEQYIALIRLYCKASVAIAYQNTWAFAEDFATEYSGIYPYYGGLSYNTQDNIAYWQYVGGTQALQWVNHCKEFCKIMAAYGINIIIPTGQAMQNIRTASFNNAHWNFTRDTLHCDYGIGRTLAAYTFYEAIIAPIVGKDIDECTYKPSVSTHVPVKTGDNWDDYSCVAVDNDKLALIKKAVKLACGNRSLTFNIESV